MNAAERSVDLNFLLLAVGAFVHLHSAPGNSPRPERGRPTNRPPSRPNWASRSESKCALSSVRTWVLGSVSSPMLGSVPWQSPSVDVIRPWAAKMFRETEGAEGSSPLNSSQFRCEGFSPGVNRHRREHTRSMCGSVFLAARGEEDRCNKNGDDDGDHKEWRSNVHGAGSLLDPEYQPLAFRFQPLSPESLADS